MASGSGSKDLPLSTVAESLENAVRRLDERRAGDLRELALFRAVKRETSDRERARLVAKLGADDPRVAALDLRGEVDDALVVELNLEAARALAAAPRVGEKGWAIHGHLLDARRRPVPGATVALYAGERWVEPLGHACTRADGYFQILSADVSATEYPPLSLRVRLRDAVVHEEREPVTVRAGTVEYREVVIEGDQAVCAPPEAAPRPAPPEATGRPDH
jgi:hypothetical protein